MFLSDSLEVSGQWPVFWGMSVVYLQRQIGASWAKCLSPQTAAGRVAFNTHCPHSRLQSGSAGRAASLRSAESDGQARGVVPGPVGSVPQPQGAHSLPDTLSGGTHGWFSDSSETTGAAGWLPWVRAGPAHPFHAPPQGSGVLQPERPHPWPWGLGQPLSPDCVCVCLTCWLSGLQPVHRVVEALPSHTQMSGLP